VRWPGFRLQSAAVCQGGQLLGYEEVAGKAIIDFLHLAGPGYVGDILEKNDFHTALSSGDFSDILLYLIRGLS
jgi:hypothetical protein